MFGVNERAHTGGQRAQAAVDEGARVMGVHDVDPLFAENGTIVFVLTEFQIIDARTAENNESGENSHDKYKERQATRVKARLMHGMKDDGLGD